MCDCLEQEESFVGKYFLLTDRYLDSNLIMWKEGFAGVVRARVGSESFLIETCKAGFKKHVVTTEFFIESSILIFDMFDELKEAKERLYRKATR
jgi:hypothetical protein